MPNSIRKEILQAVDEHIIPALWQQQVLLGYVVPPLEFPTGIVVCQISQTVPPGSSKYSGFPIQTRWPRANLWSSFYPHLRFIYEGVAEERTLITAAQADKYKMKKGVYAIRREAPLALLFPAGTPHSTGDFLYQSSRQKTPPTKALCLDLSKEPLIYAYSNDENGRRRTSHSLQINDPSILSLAELFTEELQGERCKKQSAAQALLLALMFRLQRKFRIHPPKIANTSRPPVPSVESLPPADRAAKVGREIALFIQMHLHESLSLPTIAQRADISPGHLNRIFNRIYGVSVMHYVRTQRIAAAKRILILNSENITEVAQLVGFKRANLFCRAFRHETGLTPSQFRRQARRDKNIEKVLLNK